MKKLTMLPYPVVEFHWEGREDRVRKVEGDDEHGG